MTATHSRIRPSRGAGIAAGLSALLLATAFVFMPAGTADAQRAACTDPSRALGVSRIVEIDTTRGPRFGHQQYKDLEFLADGEIVLTFDDGPLRPFTQPVVDALEAECTKATFFLVGSQAVADPDMVKQIQRKGHTVGTHTWSHANLRKGSPMKARHEMELGFSAVRAAAGQPIAPFFRFPFLADTKAMLGYAEDRNYGVFSIEVDSLDYRSKDAASVHAEILKQLAYRKKGILLFHDIQPATAKALPGLLAALRQKGYRVVHLKPKAMADSLPEFDAIAEAQMNRKRVAATGNPMAKRSVTWAMPSPQTMQPGGPGQAGPASRQPAAGVPVPAPIAVPAQAAVVPLPAPLPVAVPQEPPPRPRFRQPEPDWKQQIFAN